MIIVKRSINSTSNIFLCTYYALKINLVFNPVISFKMVKRVVFFIFFKLSPTFVRRKSKLRAITPNPQLALSSSALGAISEDNIPSTVPETTASAATTVIDPSAEEVEDSDDSDIESVMTHDDSLVKLFLYLY